MSCDQQGSVMHMDPSGRDSGSTESRFTLLLLIKDTVGVACNKVWSHVYVSLTDTADTTPEKQQNLGAVRRGERSLTRSMLYLCDW